MNELPAVSVIVPTHNRPKLLRDALASVEQQTYKGPIEIVIADDASSPPVTIPPSRFDIRIVRNSVARGGAAAKNLGIHAAQGDYLIFLDDDDLLHPGYIEDAISTLQAHPEIKTLYYACPVVWRARYVGADAPRSKRFCYLAANPTYRDPTRLVPFY